MTKFEKEVYNAVRQIPRGRVMTYGAVARVIGKPRAFRAVGKALNKNRSREIPCHRVVCSSGRVGGFNRGLKNKIILLSNEGVAVTKGVIDLTKYKCPVPQLRKFNRGSKIRTR